MASAVEPNVKIQLRVRLYVAGGAPNSLAAAANLRSALAEFPMYSADIELIDVLSDPERALRDGILVTPMLVKCEPPPERRVLGNLRDRGMLLGALGLQAERE
ncbi:MAG TPA: circadian clock KaiB family protein [Polyangiaceae bacterium]